MRRCWIDTSIYCAIASDSKRTARIDYARALCVSERGADPPPTHVLLRGSPYAEGDEVEPGFPSVITAISPTIPPPAKDSESSGRRRVLADWIASPDNPLTARVIANRLWHHHFNRGLVRSTSDFGYGGTPPTHPELLDWLATELVANGWRLKPMHKLMVMSSAYQMSSVGSREAAESDIANDLFTHFELRRLGAEEIRDTVLLVSGNFNPKRGGPSIYPTIAKDVLAGQSRPGQGWGRSTAEEEARRSVYIHVKRSLAVPLLAVFDAADTDSSCPVRFATTQPTQALTMLNSEFLNKQAAIFASDVREQATDDASGTNSHRTVARHTARADQRRDPTRRRFHRPHSKRTRTRSRSRVAKVLPPDDELERIPLHRLNLKSTYKEK